MYYHVFILLSLIFFFCGNVGSVALGLPNGLLLTLPLVYGASLVFVYKRNWTTVEKQAAWIVGGAILLLCLHYVFAPKDKIIRDVTIIFLPALLISVMPARYGLDRQTFKIKHGVAQFLLLFYVVECGIAISEFASHSHLFGWVDPTYHKGIVSFSGNDAFRSVSLMGSPLNNALIVTSMMLFYLYDPLSTIKRKVVLCMLGLVAVFCFNARMAIVISVLGILLFIAKALYNNRPGRNKYIAVLFIICLVIGFLYAHGLGTRLWETGNIGKDESIMTRIKLFQYMMDRDWKDYLWGSSRLQMQHEMQTAIKVKIVENFWIVYILRFGILSTAYFTFFYYRLGRELFRHYPGFEKTVISTLFIILGSINNSMASNFTPLFVFLLCAYAYDPITRLTEIYYPKDKIEIP